MPLFLSALALTAATLSAVAQTTPPAANAQPPAGAAPSTSTYRNDTLHLSYSYPAGYTDASSTVGPAFQASIGGADAASKSEMRCVTLPFSVMNTAGGQFSMVLLVRADAGCMKKSLTAADLPGFTKGEAQGLTASGAHTQFGEPVSFTAQGHPAQLISGTFELPTGQPLHAMAVCLLLKPDIACWQFLASSEEALRTMGAFPLTFEGAPPAPLVPPAMLAKP